MTTPSWIDRTRYPFAPHYLDLEAGRLHYVDEGEGPPIVMVHGTPTWSFLYRDLIRELSRTYRVIAPDLLGFGLSEKPGAAPAEEPYRPEAQAAYVEQLITTLGLRDLVLVVHDFGGPIGLSYALKHPDNVRGLVLFNTWMWSREDDPTTRRVGRLFGSALGRFLYRRLNISPRVLLKMAYGDRRRLTPEIHRHYLAPFPTPNDRHAPWVFARALVGASGWYEALWQQRERLRDKPALLLWGLKDPAFGADDLRRWEQLFTNARTHTFPDAGHFVQEEAPEEAARLLRDFMHERTRQPRPAAGR